MESGATGQSREGLDAGEKTQLTSTLALGSLAGSGPSGLGSTKEVTRSASAGAWRLTRKQLKVCMDVCKEIEWSMSWMIGMMIAVL